ncbi:arsenate reductase (azurin) small subunit [Paracoccus onubensis]|uniref:Arsenate reductase (Azurin) small subunit n=1 Tax=Paracoccus onubensis TaxID=1675788 RepID=A0A418T218_9RHOB|nr:arsenate reductase (azurin) small subunit [Paracoccus onubensis]RJE87238.1 arsenate reductase (azurin) small subunit [Paracoccus onubensis]
MTKCNRLIDAGRRQFLRGGMMATAGAAVTTLAGTQEAKAQAALARVDYPASRLGNIGELTENEPLDVSYPDDDSPGVLLKLGHAVEGGAGPDGDIVGFSVLCPHKGWYLGYNADDRTFNCPGHYSRFDAEAGGQQVWGHATSNLPQFNLRVDDDGEIYAEGVDELIFGRLSNTL